MDGAQPFCYAWAMRTLTYTIHLKPEPEGGFTVTVPALRGCVTYGKDYAEAIAMAQEAIEGFIEALAKAKLPIPKETVSLSLKSVSLQLPVRYPAFA